MRSQIMRNLCILLPSWVIITLNYFHAETISQSIQHQNVRFGALKSAVNESLGDSIVDFNMSELFRVYHTGNACPFKRSVLSKIAKSETVEIIIVGGSVTYGADLRDRMKERWSTRFSDILSSGWYDGKFVVKNVGVGACNIDVWIDRVKEFRNADMVIVDLSVNDQGFDLQALPLLYHTFIQLIDSLPKHPAILFHYAFRSAQNDRRDVTDHCPLPATQGACCGGSYTYCQRWWEMQDFVAITLNKFKVPFVSYRDLVWPDYLNPPATLPVLWNGKSHPDKKAHSLIAKLVAFGFMMQLKEAHNAKDCDQESRSKYVTGANVDVKVKPLCPTPLTLMRATDEMISWQSFPLSNLDNYNNSSESMRSVWPGVGDNVVEMNGNEHWRYYNDSKLKFGWILEASQHTVAASCPQGGWCVTALLNHSISLDVLLGEDPIVQISYLKSYPEIMGKATVWLDAWLNESIQIDSRWSMQYSVTRIFTLVGREDRIVNISSAILGETAVLPAIQRATAGRHVLHISASPFDGPRFKWKLLGVATC